MARGQFSIFGAVEENVGHGLAGINTDKETCGNLLLKPHAGRGFARQEKPEGKIREERAGGMSTEGAQEMQKGSGQ